MAEMKDDPKVSISIRLDPEVVAFFKAGGRGWQTRLNAALVEIVEREKAAAERRADHPPTCECPECWQEMESGGCRV